MLKPPNLPNLTYIIVSVILEAQKAPEPLRFLRFGKPNELPNVTHIVISAIWLNWLPNATHIVISATSEVTRSTEKLPNPTHIVVSAIREAP